MKSFVRSLSIVALLTLSAQAATAPTVAEAEKFMNQMNATMQGQTMKFARSELESAVKAVKGAK